jgi:hypothetical protein
MSQTVVPMIHVPDVRATVAWYTSIGFTLVRQKEEDGESNWAKRTFGNSEVMMDSGGKPSTEHRREVDLYILTDNVDDLRRGLKDRVQIVEDLMTRSTGCVSSSCATSTDSGSPSASPSKPSRSPI